MLRSDAPPQDKAIPCKQLAIYGSKEAVPALAALLSNPELASLARIALEAIPEPAASAEEPTGPGMSTYRPPTCCWRRPTVASEGLLRRTSVPHAA